MQPLPPFYYPNVYANGGDKMNKTQRKSARYVRKHGTDFSDNAYQNYIDTDVALRNYYNDYCAYNAKRFALQSNQQANAEFYPMTIAPVNIYGNDSAKSAAFNNWFMKHPDSMATKRNLRSYSGKYSPELWDNYYQNVAIIQPKTANGAYDFSNPYIQAMPDAYKRRLFKANVSERPDYKGLSNFSTGLAMSPLFMAGAANAGTIGEIIPTASNGLRKIGTSVVYPMATSLTGSKEILDKTVILKKVILLNKKIRFLKKDYTKG